MKRLQPIVTALLYLPMAAMLAPTAAGQDVVSAMAGYIHFAQGGVSLDGKPFEFNPAEFVHAGNGQRLRTSDGWAEVMITPGSFIRLAPNSELEMIEAGTLAAHMRLTEGSATVDLGGAVDTAGMIVEMGEARVRFAKGGLYRFDLPAGGNPMVRVARGRAKVELRGEFFDVGGKRQLTIASSIEKLKAQKTGKLEEDEFDRWDAHRRDLLAAEARKRNRDPDTGLVSRRSAPTSDCRACRVAPGRDPKTQPRTRPPGYPLVRLSGDWP